MSNAYFCQLPDPGAMRTLAHSFSALLASGHERVNHYAESNGAIFGLVSPDKFGQGAMPSYLEESGFWGLLVGELHPCAALDRCRHARPDAETDLALLASLARDKQLLATLPALNGAFFFMLWDPEARTLIAANDRYGLYPMYWAQKDGRYCLSSRTLGPVLAGVVPGGIDTLAVAQILTVDDFVGGRTLVKDVSAFPPGTMMTKTPDRIDWQTYWVWDYPAEQGLSAEEWGRRAGAALVEAVRRQAGAGRSIGVTLSGGLDSRCVAAAAVQTGISPRTFTWGEDGCYDRLYASEIARALGIEHQDCPYEYDSLAERFEEGVAITEGMCNAFDMHFLAHLHIIAGVDVVLNGFAGDAVLGETFLRPQWASPMRPAELAENLFHRYNRFLKEAELPEAMPVVRD
ncbi:MAG TPA: asparagine synthase-related protein, partial [Candidatus Hydrogenedentes bacterium]|nr:asparagine synthase-related protein [Candidatus Hydrogenedentota bacterium]